MAAMARPSNLVSLNMEAVRLARAGDHQGAVGVLDELFVRAAANSITHPQLHTCLSNRAASLNKLGALQATFIEQISKSQCRAGGCNAAECESDNCTTPLSKQDASMRPWPTLRKHWCKSRQPYPGAAVVLPASASQDQRWMHSVALRLTCIIVGASTCTILSMSSFW